MAKTDIIPRTKVADLLKDYPELEETLIEAVPAFSKLKNPILRRTVAKVTTLQQAAKIGEVSVDKLINTLRKVVGQPPLQVSEGASEEETPPPDWFDEKKIVKTFDARELLEKGEYPYQLVSAELKGMKEEQILRVIADFLPVPLIEKIEEQGYAVWSKKAANTYEIFLKK